MIGGERRLRWILRSYPEEFRDAHVDEITTTLSDASGGGKHRMGLLDSINLLWAGLRIRARTLSKHRSIVDIKSGVTLGVRIALFVQAVVAGTFFWSSSIVGQSIWSRSISYPDSARLLLGALLLPWILAFVAQLFAWWRTALVLAAFSPMAGLVLVYYKLAVSPFGLGQISLAAIMTSLVATVFLAVGLRLSAVPVGRPWAVMTLGVAVVGAYTTYVDGLIYNLTTPLVVTGLGFLLIALGMAISGSPQALIACAVVAFPAIIVAGEGRLLAIVGPLLLDRSAALVIAAVISAAMVALAVNIGGAKTGAGSG